MAKFRYKGRGTVSVGDYYWESQSVVDVTDPEILQKLRGRPGGNSHPSFEEVVE